MKYYKKLVICKKIIQKWVLIYETCECDIRAPDIYRFLRVDELSTGPLEFGASHKYVQNSNQISYLSCTFFPTHFILQDLYAKEKIANSRESGGLYYLEDEFQHFIKGQAHLVQKDSMEKKKRTNLVMTSKIEASIFFYIKRLFHSLFKGLNV